MKVFTYSVDGCAEVKTEVVHHTLSYLCWRGYIAEEIRDQLQGSLIVVPVRNRPDWPARLLGKFFGKNNNNENCYSFPIVDVGDYGQDEPERGRPSQDSRVLKLIHDSDQGSKD